MFVSFLLLWIISDSTFPFVFLLFPPVYVAKISVLFRGMGSAIGGKYMRCSKRWWKHAYQALLEAGEDIDWLRSHRDATRLYY